MKKIAVIVSVAAALAIPTASFAAIGWNSCDKAAAAPDGAVVMLMIHAPSSVESRAAVKAINASAEFAEAAAGTFAVSCDAGTVKGKEQAERFKAVAFPTVIFLDAKGRETDRLAAFDDMSKSAADVAAIKSGKNISDESARKADKEKENLQVWFDAGSRWAYRGDAEKAKKYLGKVLTADSANKTGLASKSVFILGKYVFLLGSRDYDNASLQLEQIKKYFPASPEARGINVFLATAYLKAKREGQAVKLMRKAVEDNNNEAAPYLEFAQFSLMNSYKLEEGLEKAQKATGLNPANPEAWMVQAKIESALGKTADSLKSAEESAKNCGDDQWYRQEYDVMKAASPAVKAENK
ncbi:MAG: tetratricopeptide repeat protein [Myxococcota bacterium]|jgi:tetratricopeptide (TPR) repeat protein